MKHVLHKKVSGKEGSDGKKYFHIYVSFTDKRQTYRLKSQLVTRPVTKEEFDVLTRLYDGKISDLLNKEREILFYSRDINTIGDDFDRNQFRTDYIDLSRNLIDIVKEVRATTPISNWTIPGISWELTKEMNIEDETRIRISDKNYRDEDLFELEVNLLQYQLAMRKSDLINGLCLKFDWKHGGLKKDFNEFLKRQHSTARSNALIKLLDFIMDNN